MKQAHDICAPQETQKPQLPEPDQLDEGDATNSYANDALYFAKGESCHVVLILSEKPQQFKVRWVKDCNMLPLVLKVVR